MERLTLKKEDRYFENEEFWVSAEQPSEDKIDDVYFKLAEFEDFMEEQKVESLEHLAYYLKTLKKARKVNGELNVECCKQKKENQALKDRWQKLKEFVKEKGYNYFKKGLFFEIEDDFKEVLFKMQELEKE